jgi:hypothetical protein
LHCQSLARSLDSPSVVTLGKSDSKNGGASLAYGAAHLV